VGFDHPVCDCVYLALAEKSGAPIIGDDGRLPALGARLQATVYRLGHTI